MKLFRERLLARLLESHAISPELVAKLVSWKHSGFSAHVGEPIEPAHKQHLEDTAAYLVRNPLSLKKLVYLDGERAVIYRSRMNPSLGRNFEALDPLFYGEYSNRVRGSGHPGVAFHGAVAVQYHTSTAGTSAAAPRRTRAGAAQSEAGRVMSG